ncbi:MAG: penicillin-binding transpeptidase domain-containing protein, partial [Chloroflexota bacterium]
NQILASGPGWYIGVGTTTPKEGERLLGMGFDALVVNRYTSRYYANSGSASQVLGYTLSISPENQDAYLRRGYCLNDRVGYAGIERAEEDALAGKHGGTLYVVGPQGQILSQLAKSEPQPASAVYLTLDKNLQYQAERAIAGFTGAVVVIERDTGRVLAMASSPGFDSNLFDPQNYNNYANNGAMLNALLNDPERPMLNRAAQGQYPLGSVFKVITFSAALESGLYLPETTYDCQYDFTEIQGVVKHDWTWEHCQDRLRRGLFCDTSDSTPSGLLTLSEGLMRSCNPYFWHIGVDLFRNGRPNDIANMARAFGLGSPTGIEIDEEPGNIADPTDEIAATNQAIGQGDVLVTPLQVARFMAAIGNGGTMYRPHIVEKIVGPDGQAAYAFAPDPVGKLPIQPERLEALQDAMVMVIRERRGTANFRIGSMSIPVAGKTGTAESNTSGFPHAWFAGYTFFNEEDTKLKNIAIAVVLEYTGEGSDYAAPVFRRIVESYIYGYPQTLYWFESNFGVTRTPTPFGGIPTNTPKPK